ncbi:peptidoglycan-binding domain-containing protein [Nocardiopsis sp. CA-288880]|uniref:peptidoglycan-binding domain-containing protein n=1 Tax=Nocardiopsis sp. CA-288880 TaxID=3239995 RepID=UPI003D96AF80
MIGLKQGDGGEKVAYLQELLIAAGHLDKDPGADGKYGSETTAAVRKAREAQGSTKPGTPITGTAGGQVMKEFVEKVAGVK